MAYGTGGTADRPPALPPKPASGPRPAALKTPRRGDPIRRRDLPQIRRPAERK